MDGLLVAVLQGPPHAGNAERPRRAREPRPRQAGHRDHGPLAGHPRHLLPTVDWKIPARSREPREPGPGLTLADRVVVPDQCLPVLRVQGEPEAGPARLRPLPVVAGDHRSLHGAPLREHAVRAARRRPLGARRRRVRQHDGARVGDGVAIEGRRRRAWGDAGEREEVQWESDEDREAEEGDADEAEL